ncbi:MAG: betaine/proline/choline family ABC transporter ATP-binding protein, partial [Eubacterium sp.]
NKREEWDMIQFENVSKSYGKNCILKNMNFMIPDGKFVVLIGKSGCGKTTTLKMINRLITPTSGKVLIDGKDISQMNPPELRRHIGYVIQQIGLFPNMTIEQNVSVVPKLLKYDKEQCHKIADALLKSIHMEQYRDKYPSELSGGQQQRIGVLRALAASPPVVLMDEPFGALDPMTRDELQIEIKKMQRKLNKTIVFVTHDMNEALRLADIIVFIDGGEIIQMDSPEEILRHPANQLVRDFLGKHVSEEQKPSKVEDFMLTNVKYVKASRGVRECAEMMARNSIDSLLAIDDDGRYIGTIKIGDMMHWGKNLDTVEPLIRTDVRTVRVGEEAKESFDYLLDTNADYVVVLNQDQTIAGIITKTSVARSVAENLWGGEEA